MNSKSWEYYWYEHFFKHALLITEENPIHLGWCVYIEPLDWD